MVAGAGSSSWTAGFHSSVTIRNFKRLQYKRFEAIKNLKEVVLCKESTCNGKISFWVCRILNFGDSGHLLYSQECGSLFYLNLGGHFVYCRLSSFELSYKFTDILPFQNSKESVSISNFIKKICCVNTLGTEVFGLRRLTKVVEGLGTIKWKALLVHDFFQIGWFSSIFHLHCLVIFR